MKNDRLPYTFQQRKLWFIDLLFSINPKYGFVYVLGDNGGLELSIAQRKFFTEVAALVDSSVVVSTTTGKTYSGTLVGISPDSLSLCLAEAKDAEGKTLHRVFLNGSVVAEILSVEKPFDLKALADRLEKVFPTMVKLYEDNGFIWVMNKVKVTEKGVVEGSGPAAERVQSVYEHFMSEIKG